MSTIFWALRAILFIIYESKRGKLAILTDAAHTIHKTSFSNLEDFSKIDHF
jgi:hypothetical protein